ncbi:pyruvate formate lyase family protein [uncultured Roseobacter sp.]|uniref:pyruvate formate lyase family protein n=1 Tax=uncultured Roseobacter sp. TaxID=114847 RepID=UPI002638AB33|nr:pyruvate formate lyase family protein [uncultured Roseobacter sp.]
MHHSILQYWQHLEMLPPGNADLPRPRVCRLMLAMFEGWRTRQPFPEFGYFGHIRDVATLGTDIMAQPLEIRRGHAMAETLRKLVDPEYRHDGFMKVHPDELIVGAMPPFSVGQGKEVMEYFQEGDEGDEALRNEVGFLNAWSNFGHICPDHAKVVNEGIDAIIADCAARAKNAKDARQVAFYAGVQIALEGVLDFAEGYAAECEREADKCDAILKGHPDHAQVDILKQRIAGMRDAADRLRRVPAKPCKGFLDAVQCIYLMNCALHWTGELSSLGRLDQILQPFLDTDELNEADAQEIIDCLWVKLDERATLDNSHVADHFTSADGALMGVGGPSNFDQGALVNQWMQQVTLGGVIADEALESRDACNAVTRLCLNSTRKLPFNCPTVDLRVHKDIPADILDLAASAILSGGAHPILMNDDKIIPALYETHDEVRLSDARDYACDGCYETHFAGKTEFSFYYVFGIDNLEKALNSGAGFGGSGATHLRGTKASWRTPQARDIKDFEDFYSIFEHHVVLSSHRGVAGLLAAYGAKGRVCPSPILSSMIKGCIEKGRDFYDGGAHYHVFAPLMTGISTVADSMHVIRKLVFDEGVISLEELVACLRSDWGKRPITIGKRPTVERISEIREMCLVQQKFGHGNREVDELAWRVIDTFCDANREALEHSVHTAGLERLQEQFGSADNPFIMAITPGVGTFEQYAFGGMFAGATPDGRSAGQPIASDLAASPWPQDLDPRNPETGEPLLQTTFSAALPSWNDKAINRLSDGAPADINIREDFPPDELASILRRFAKGEGSNMMTVTVANHETLEAASARPDDFDLLRVRMGGWTEFYSTLFDNHKQQHRRRPLYLADGGAK